MSRTRLLGVLALLIGGIVLAGHGAAPPAAVQAQGESVLGVWTDVAPLPAGPLKRAAAATFPANGKIYLFGGRNGIDGDYSANDQDTILEYTPGTPGTWAIKNAHIPHPQNDRGRVPTANMVAATLTGPAGDAIYVIGGSNLESVPTSTVRIYQPQNDTISVLTTDPWPASPRVPGGYATYGNKLFIFGGFNAYTHQLFADTWRFDPLAAPGQRWSRLPANLSAPRAYIAGAALDGYIYAIGGDGYLPPNLVPVRTVERMNPRALWPRWEPVASLPSAMGDMGAWAFDTGTPYSLAGSIVVAGGVWYQPKAQGYQYIAAQNAWVTFANLTHATRDYGYAQLGGALYTFGGYDLTNHQPDSGNWVQNYQVGPSVSPP